MKHNIEFNTGFGDSRDLLHYNELKQGPCDYLCVVTSEVKTLLLARKFKSREIINYICNVLYDLIFLLL